MKENFWSKLDKIFSESEIMIDRPKGSNHPKFPAMVFPLDYGYLKDTSGGDGNEIDLWLGSMNERKIDSIVCTVDILKKDTEIKLLCGCTEEDKNLILSFHNDSEYMSAFIIERDTD